MVSSALFVWLISHQPAVLFSQNKPATSNQPAVLFSQNKSASAISHQPNEQAVGCYNSPLLLQVRVANFSALEKNEVHKQIVYVVVVYLYVYSYTFRKTSDIN
jgi:hypothetical protein